MVRVNARRKAEAVARAEETVLGADTVVVLEDRIYGQPADAGAARATLEALSGREHCVLSGVCVLHRGEARQSHALTRVRFRTLSARELDWYLESGEWRSRAGAYAIQARGAALVEAIAGDYQNVVGLPVATLLGLVPDLLDTAR